MGRQLKVFSGTAIAPPAIAAVVRQHHCARQVTAYAVATTKAAAFAELKKHGLHVPANRFSQASGLPAAALAAAGQFDAPTVLITHLMGTGPVARLAADQDPVVIGQLVRSNRGNTVVGATVIGEFRYRFVPADPS